MVSRLEDFYRWLQEHSVTYLQLLVLLVALFCVWWKTLGNPSKPSVRREPQMDKDMSAQDVKEEKSALADDFFDILFKRYGEGKLSRDRYKYWMHRLGCDLNLPDLLPKLRMTHPSAIKAQARRTKNAIMERLGPEKVEAVVTKVRTTPKLRSTGKLNIDLKEAKS